MFSEYYKRGVCLDDLDVGLDWNALIIKITVRAGLLATTTIKFFGR